MSIHVVHGWECPGHADLFEVLAAIRTSSLIEIEHDLKRLVVELGGQNKMSGRFELLHILTRLITTENRTLTHSVNDINTILFIKKVGSSLVFLPRNQSRSYDFMSRVEYMTPIPFWNNTDKPKDIPKLEWERRGDLWASFYKVKEFVKFCVIDPENPEQLLGRILIPELDPQKDVKGYWNVPG